MRCGEFDPPDDRPATFAVRRTGEPMSKLKHAVWVIRNDMRLADNAALRAALDSAESVIPLLVLPGEADEDEFSPGAASRVWLHHSACSLDRSLRAKGSRLIVRRGPLVEAVIRLIDDLGSSCRVFLSRGYEPRQIADECALDRALDEMNVSFTIVEAARLFGVDDIRTKAGDPFKVFTPFYKACLSGDLPDEPRPSPKKIPAPASWPESLAPEAYGLLPQLPWDAAMIAHWQPGEDGASALLEAFLGGPVEDYAAARDLPAETTTSRLSPHLAFGEISGRQIWHAALENYPDADISRRWKTAPGPYLRQLAWREFAAHLLYHFPETARAPLRPEFERFPWTYDDEHFRAWSKGRTGYPMVDAAMRQLWQTGWMHNRLRMVVASFLVKHLLMSWRDGAKWFWDTLVDADLANNTLGWQWTAGCGADAAPYFRIFNPTAQGERFDADGEYVRRWVPELADLPAKHIHAPWSAPAPVLREAGVELGETYPAPIVDHKASREAALGALKTIKKR